MTETPHIFTVNEQDNNLRVDKFLAIHVTELSRSQIKKSFIHNNIRINDIVVHADTIVHTGDTIVANLIHPPETALQPSQIALKILFEDDDIIIIDKQPNIVVHPGNGTTSPTLVEGVLAHTHLSTLGGNLRPGVVHRLDKDTSGIIVFAKSDIAYLNMIKMFSERRLQKSYYAIVCGTFDKQHGIIECPIGRHPTQRTKMAVITSGRQAVTHWQFDKKLSYNLSALKIKILTGRTHQIRVHLSHIGHPLLGDTTYGYKTNYITNIVPPRVMLHASNLEFCHPITGDKISIESPLSDDFCTVINELSC